MTFSRGVNRTVGTSLVLVCPFAGWVSSCGGEAIVTILSIEHGFIPATLNYEYPDPDCDLDAVYRDE